MSRKPSKKPRPKPSPTVVIANKQKAAIGQLESAILLWFNDADPIPMLVLATNAEDCLNAVGSKIGKPSMYKVWLGTMPDAFQERARYIQDFAKHGFMDLEEGAEFEAKTAERLMIASVTCYEEIYSKATPLMVLFAARFFYENPEMVLPNVRARFIESATIQGVRNGTRKDCFEKFQPSFSRTV